MLSDNEKFVRGECLKHYTKNSRTVVVQLFIGPGSLYLELLRTGSTGRLFNVVYRTVTSAFFSWIQKYECNCIGTVMTDIDMSLAA